MRQFAELAGDVRDPYPMLAGIRTDSPVLHVELGTGSRYRHDQKAPPITSLFTVTSHELAQQVLTDNVRFSSAGYEMTMGQVMGRTILQMDPPEHLRHRALVAKAFRARALDQWSNEIIGATVGELIDAFARDGHADLIPQLTFPFPVRVIARILGLPEADWPRFLRLSTELISVMRNWDRAVAASQELRGYFAEIIADRRRHTRDDLVSQLIEAGRSTGTGSATTRSIPSCCCSCPPGRRPPTVPPATCCSACCPSPVSWTRSAPTGTWCRRRSRRR